jgi:hypothetical protein
MKAFRGTFLALLALVAVALAVWWLRPAVQAPVGEVRLFQFEKHELTRVEVKRADGSTVALSEKDGQWTIEGTDFTAGRSMVNRVKHQIHDLTSRATVVDAPDNAELYGLGKNAIHVKLELRDGRVLEFLAGDPNPSSVSYYIQPLPGSTIYTVKKSAVDYYSLTLDEFRERRFASFDSKDVTAIEARVDALAGGAKDPGNHDGTPRYRVPRVDLRIELTGEREWQMRSPVEMAANDDRVRKLLGRVSALKASDFQALPEGGDLAPYGLDQPRADITVRFSSREPLRLLVGADGPSSNRFEELAWMMLEGDDTIYLARSGLLEEFTQDPAELRNRRVVRMKATDVASIDVRLRADPAAAKDLEGEAGVRYAADQWVWKDGVPVPGSTPERVARQLAELEVEAFVDDQPKALSAYGLDDPLARAVLADQLGNERVVLLGAEGPTEVDPEGRDRRRRYVAIEGAESIYLVDERVLSVVEDLVRESNRKRDRDLEKAARRERIGSTLPDDAGEGAP